MECADVMAESVAAARDGCQMNYEPTKICVGGGKALKELA